MWLWRCQAQTHNDDGAGDGDSSHHAVWDGVGLVRVTYALVLAVHASNVGREHDGHDDERHRRWTTEKDRWCGYCMQANNVRQKPNLG